MLKLLTTLMLILSAQSALAGNNQRQERESKLASCAQASVERYSACMLRIKGKMTRQDLTLRLLNCTAAYRDALENCILAHLKGESL